MWQSSRICEPIEHLRDSGTRLVGLFLITPVSSGQWILQTFRDDTGTNTQLQVEITPFVYVLLSHHAHFFQKIAEKPAKEEG